MSQLSEAVKRLRGYGSTTRAREKQHRRFRDGFPQPESTAEDLREHCGVHLVGVYLSVLTDETDGAFMRSKGPGEPNWLPKS